MHRSMLLVAMVMAMIQVIQAILATLGILVVMGMVLATIEAMAVVVVVAGRGGSDEEMTMAMEAIMAKGLLAVEPLLQSSMLGRRRKINS